MASPRSGFAAQASLGELIRTLPVRQLMLLWLAVFSTFATIAFMLDIIMGGRFPIAWLASMALVSGTLSVGFTATSLRRRWFAFASLVAVADRPLAEIAGHLLSGAQGHGAQLDDQSLLLIRRGAPGAPY